MEDFNLLKSLFYISFVFACLVNFLINYVRKLPKGLAAALKYGRANVEKHKSTIITKLEVPKRWFVHFYAYAVIFQAWILWCIYKKFRDRHDPSLSWTLDTIGSEDRGFGVDNGSMLLVATLFWLHLCRRLYETLFVSIFSGTKMNVIQYGLGYLHYSGAIVAIILHNDLFTLSRFRGPSTPNYIPFNWIFGFAIFLYGTFEQNRAHRTYAALRTGKGNKVSLQHKIAHGGLFEYISCPNYFAEILIYLAIVIIFNFQNSTWNAVFMWVLGNQIAAGVMNHKWSQDSFPDYPKNRKAIIPFIW